jgi:hypothetical protein
MHTGLPAAPLRQAPSVIRDDRFTRCPFPAATTDAPVAPVRSSNTAMEHQNCCTDLRHPELLAACCPYSSVHGKLVVQHPSRTKKVGKLPPLRSFSFLTLRDLNRDAVLVRAMCLPESEARQRAEPGASSCLRPSSDKPGHEREYDHEIVRNKNPV